MGYTPKWPIFRWENDEPADGMSKETLPIISEAEGYPWAIKSRSWMQFNPLMKGTGRQWGYWYCRAVVPLRLRLQVRQRCSSLIISSCSIFLLGDCHHSHRGGYYGSTTRFAQPGLLKGTGSVAAHWDLCENCYTKACLIDGGSNADVNTWWAFGE